MRVLLSLAIVILAVKTPLGAWMEADMARHMLMQFPLLLGTGGLLGLAMSEARRQRIARYNAHGLAGLLLFLLVIAFWMIPRALDQALYSSGIESAKVISLLCAGAALQHSWRAAGPIVQIFVLGNWGWMTVAVGLFYQDNPVRLCNFYLVDQQVRAGQGLVALPLIVALAWIMSMMKNGYLENLMSDN